MSPAIDVMLTMRPLPRATMCGAACFAERAVVTFTASVRSQSARSTSMTRGSDRRCRRCSRARPEPAQLGDRGRDHALHRGLVGDVGDQGGRRRARLADLRGRRLERIASRRREHHGRALGGEAQRDRAADAAPAAGDQRDLPREPVQGWNLARTIPAALLGPRRALHGAFRCLPLDHDDREQDEARAEPPARREALGAERQREHQREHRLEREQEADAARRERALREHLEQRRERAAGDGR